MPRSDVRLDLNTDSTAPGLIVPLNARDGHHQTLLEPDNIDEETDLLTHQLKHQTTNDDPPQQYSVIHCIAFLQTCIIIVGILLFFFRSPSLTFRIDLPLSQADSNDNSILTLTCSNGRCTGSIIARDDLHHLDVKPNMQHRVDTSDLDSHASNLVIHATAPPPAIINSNTTCNCACSTPSPSSSSSSSSSHIIDLPSVTPLWPPIPGELPDPPPSTGRFILFTKFFRESNRHFELQRIIRFMMATDRRLVLLPYEGVDIDRMYDIPYLEAQISKMRDDMGRPPLNTTVTGYRSSAHILTWSEYHHHILGGPLHNLTSSQQCLSLTTPMLCGGERDSHRNECLPRTCNSSQPFTVKDGLTPPISLNEIRSMTEPLLVLSGSYLWNYYGEFGDWLKLEVKQRSPYDQRYADGVYHSLAPFIPIHPNIMSRAREFVTRMREEEDDPLTDRRAPFVAIHMRLDDLADKITPLATRINMTLQHLDTWHIDRRNMTLFIATDTNDPHELSQLRSISPRAHIGFPSSYLRPDDPPVFLVLLDKATCILSDYFIGSNGSSYSTVIRMLQHRKRSVGV